MLYESIPAAMNLLTVSLGHMFTGFAIISG